MPLFDSTEIKKKEWTSLNKVSQFVLHIKVKLKEISIHYLLVAMGIT
jgi:hypothetical protein